MMPSRHAKAGRVLYEQSIDSSYRLMQRRLSHGITITYNNFSTTILGFACERSTLIATSEIACIIHLPLKRFCLTVLPLRRVCT